MNPEIDPKPRSSDFLREKMRKLEGAYLARLPETLTTILELRSTLAADPDAETVIADLHRTFHSMRGTAATLGLQQISSQGAIGEELMLSFRGMPPDQRRHDLVSTLGQIDACIARIEAAGAEASMLLAGPGGD